jgi:hypothetical protein
MQIGTNDPEKQISDGRGIGLVEIHDVFRKVNSTATETGRVLDVPFSIVMRHPRIGAQGT